MEIFLIVAAIAGILAGLRFKVFVLLPMILLAAGVAILTSDGLKITALTVLSTVILLQIGYLIGCIVRAYFRHMIAPVKPANSLPDPSNTP